MFESVSSKRRVGEALGDGKINKYKSLIRDVCHSFNLLYFVERGPVGAMLLPLDRAAQTTKEESLLFIHPDLALPGVKMTIDRPD